MAPPADRVIVLGATSLVGAYLLPLLRQRGFEVHAVSRRARPAHVPAEVHWHQVDIGRGIEAWPASAGQAVHLAPLWLAPALVRPLAARGVRRLVAFGSTSRFTKIASADSREQALARRLAAAEKELAAACAQQAVAWTLFRPTLIYGAERDGNLSRIARLVRRFGVFALPRTARGRRQPVHAEDLAMACVQVLATKGTSGHAYDLGGGTTLTYREMIEGIFRGVGRPPRIMSVPRWSLRLLLRLRRLSPEVADRMEEDLIVDWSPAARDFGYAPRAYAYPDGAATGG